MPRALLILRILLTILSTQIFAQHSAFIKMDAGLRHLISDSAHTESALNKFNTEGSGPSRIRILAEGSRAREAVLQAGGHINTDLGTLISASIPAEHILMLAEHPGIQRLCLPRRYRRHNDLLTAAVRANQVVSGMPPLSQPLTGRGVIIGIIDSGIDISHPDFKTADGFTRIVSVWDQNLSGTHPPAGDGYHFDYGHEWTRTDIDNGLCTHKDQDGHGTHVAGIAAGNGRALSQYRGVAPESEIVIVADNGEISNSLVDAANYIFGKARSLGRPCVINASLGSHQGGHDGTDLESRMLDQLIMEYNGQAFCASAGNEGEDAIHIGYNTSSDSVYSYVYPGYDNTIMLYLRIPNDALGRVHVSVGWDEHNFNPYTGTGGPTRFGGHTPWFTVQETVDSPGLYEKARINGREVGRVSFEFDTQNDDFTVLRILIEDETVWNDDLETVENMELWRLRIRNPDAGMDTWVADLGATYPGPVADPRYRTPDNASSVGVPALAHYVIAVGASVNRESYVDQFGDTWICSDAPAGSLAGFSSRGPTADGRLKPEITAPGLGVISALSVQALNSDEIDDTDIIAGAKYVVLSGTSMSSPAVAGCIALILQNNPQASYSRILEAVTQTAHRDTQTGYQLPDNRWGYGKIDGFAMLTGQTEIMSTLSKPDRFRIFPNVPNPFNQSTLIQYVLPATEHVRLKVFNARGETMLEIDLGIKSPGLHRVHVDSGRLPSGVYSYTLQSESALAAGRMILIQ